MIGNAPSSFQDKQVLHLGGKLKSEGVKYRIGWIREAVMYCQTDEKSLPLNNGSHLRVNYYRVRLCVPHADKVNYLILV